MLISDGLGGVKWINSKTSLTSRAHSGLNKRIKRTNVITTFITGKLEPCLYNLEKNREEVGWLESYSKFKNLVKCKIITSFKPFYAMFHIHTWACILEEYDDIGIAKLF